MSNNTLPYYRATVINNMTRRFQRLAVLVGVVLTGAMYYVITSHAVINRTKTTMPEPIPGVPYKYTDQVDVRFIVLTYNRASSVSRCLLRLQEVILDGHSGAVEIWVDRSKTKNAIDNATLQVVQNFLWKHGPRRVHVWPRHVGLYGQWIDTWRPAKGSKEIAIYIEDDVDVSPFAFRWLRHARATYGARNDIGSFTLSDENLLASGPHIGQLLKKPLHDVAYLYPILGTWGMSPVASSWRDFQDWYHRETGPNVTKRIHPYTPGADLHTGWYKTFEKSRTPDRMFSMWYIYYCHLRKHFAVYPNTGVVRKARGKSLSRHRAAKGLNYHSAKEVPVGHKLLSVWDNEFVNFPKDLLKYNYNGTIIR